MEKIIPTIFPKLTIPVNVGSKNIKNKIINIIEKHNLRVMLSMCVNILTIS